MSALAAPILRLLVSLLVLCSFTVRFQAMVGSVCLRSVSLGAAAKYVRFTRVKVVLFEFWKVLIASLH